MVDLGVGERRNAREPERDRGREANVAKSGFCAADVEASLHEIGADGEDDVELAGREAKSAVGMLLDEAFVLLETLDASPLVEGRDLG